MKYYLDQYYFDQYYHIDIMSKYIDLSSDSSEDTSLDGFIVRDKKHKKHNEHKPHKKHLKRKRSESLDQDSQESLESQESIDQDDDFESPVSSLLVNLGRYFDIDKSAARMQIAKQIQINLPSYHQIVLNN